MRVERVLLFIGIIILAVVIAVVVVVMVQLHGTGEVVFRTENALYRQERQIDDIKRRLEDLE